MPGDEVEEFWALKDVSLTLKAGEIVGVAGVSGNGQSELLEVLSGLRAPEAGRMVLGGASFTPGFFAQQTN